jgi:hypothetical protein
VTNAFPANGTKALRTTNVTAAFSEDMDPLSLTAVYSSGLPLFKTAYE